MSVIHHQTGSASRRGAPSVGLLFSLVAVSIALLNVAANSAPLLTGDGGTPAFYAWSGELDGQPGKILRQEPGTVDLANAGQSVRILYISPDGLDGKRKVAVSGVLYVPKGVAPKDGWPLIAWAHGPVGVAEPGGVVEEEIVVVMLFRGGRALEEPHPDHRGSDGGDSPGRVGRPRNRHREERHQERPAAASPHHRTLLYPHRPGFPASPDAPS